jgi:hypothetical protein
MSLADLIPAIRALPKSEQVKLLHLLVDGVAEVSPGADPTAPDGVTNELRKLLPPNGVAEVWFPEANPEAVAAALQAINEFGAHGE